MSTAVLPQRIFIVTTHMLDHEPDARSLFRPCEFGGHWRTDLPEARRFNDFDASLAQQLRTAGPHFSAEIAAAPVDCCPALRAVRARHLGRPVDLTLRSVSFGLTDVGHGAMTMEYAVRAARDRRVVALRTEDDRVEITDLSIVAHLRPDIVDLVARHVADVRLVGQSTPVGVTCLWGHVLYDLPVAPGPQLSGVLAPDTLDDSSLIRIGAGLVKPGLGSSVAAGLPADATGKVARVLALISAYYAAAAEMDRLIFAELEGRRRHLGHDGAGLVYDRLFEDVSVFQGILSTLDLHLAASTAFEVRLWGRFARTWQLGLQLQALTDKLTLLRAFQEREAARVEVARTGRLAVIAVVFTVLNFVSTLLDLIDFSQGAKLSRPDDLRSVISLALTSGVVLIFAYWARRRPASRK